MRNSFPARSREAQHYHLIYYEKEILAASIDGSKHKTLTMGLQFGKPITDWIPQKDHQVAAVGTKGLHNSPFLQPELHLHYHKKHVD